MKKNRNFWDKNYMVNQWTMFYCMILFLIFPLYYQNSYINILEAKTEFFLISTVIYLVGCILCMLPPVFMAKRKKEKQNIDEKKRKNIAVSDIFCLVFTLSILMSVIISDNRKEVLWGTNGRLFGAVVLLCCVGLYYCISRFFRWNSLLFWCCLGGAVLVSILAILNRFGIDILGMYEVIDSSQAGDYLSTIGQINILSGYLCIFFPIFTGLFLYSHKVLSKCFYGAGTIFVLIAGVCSNSDSFFLAIGIIVIFYFTIFLDNKDKLSDLVLLNAVGSVAMMIMALISNRIGLTVWREFQNIWLNKISWVVLFAVFCFLYFILRKGDIFSETALKKIKQIWLIILLFLIFSVLIYIILANLKVIDDDKIIAKNWLIFCDEWGTNRGYVWKRTLSLFTQLPLKNQIFGIGPGEFSSFFEEYFIESISKFGYYFEDAHNEFLQFLVTTGIVGMIGYAGMIISAFISCIKEKTDMKIILAVFFLVWMAQGMVNNPLVFTVPYLFVIMGMSQVPWTD